MKALLKVFALTILVWPMFPKESFGFYEHCEMNEVVPFPVADGWNGTMELCGIGLSPNSDHIPDFSEEEMVLACESQGGQVLRRQGSAEPWRIGRQWFFVCARASI